MWSNINLHTKCLAINGNKIKHYVSSTMSVLEKFIYFQTLDLIKFLMCSGDLNMCTISVMTHITGIGKHFIGNPLCSSNYFVMQLIHILHSFMIMSFTHPQKKKSKEKSGE